MLKMMHILTEKQKQALIWILHFHSFGSLHAICSSPQKFSPLSYSGFVFVLSLLHEEVMCVNFLLSRQAYSIICWNAWRAEGRETNEILKTCCSSSRELNPSFLLPFCCWRKSWLRNEFSSSSRKEKGQFPKKPSSYFNSSSLSTAFHDGITMMDEKSKKPRCKASAAADFLECNF